MIAFVQLMTAVGFSSIFPFLPLYVKDLGTNTSLSVELLAGLVFSAQAFTMMIASPIWGSLADRYGRKLMVERATYGGAVLLLLMAFVTSAEQLVALRAVQGLITGTLAAANALVASAAPRERTGYAMGMLQVSLGAGVAVGPLIGGAAADAFGYSAAFFITAGLLAIAGVTVTIGVREDFEPLVSLTRSPLGFVAEWRAILRVPGVATSYGMRFISNLSRLMLLPIAPLFISELVGEAANVNTITGLVTGVGAAAVTVSSLFLAPLGDRIGHRRVLIGSMLTAGLMYFPMSRVSSAWQLLLLLALSGIAMGGVIPTVSALLARYSDAGSEGAVFGLDNSVRSGARTIAPLVGAGVALAFSMRAAYVATGVLLVSGALLAAWLLPRPARQPAPAPGD